MKKAVEQKGSNTPKRKGNLFDMILLGGRNLTMLMIAITMIGICIHVFGRYLFGSPINWFIDVATLFMFYLTFLGSAWLLHENGHVSMDFLYHMIGEQKYRKVDIVISITSAAACLLVAIYGVVELIDAYAYDIAIDMPSAPPKWIVLIMIPIAFITLAIEFVRKALHGIFTPKESREKLS